MLKLHELTIDMRDESNKPTIKLIFSDFQLEWQKMVEDEFTCDLVLGALEAIDSLEQPESHMLRSRKPRNKLRKSNSWPKITPLNYLKNKRLSTYGTSIGTSNVLDAPSLLPDRINIRPTRKSSLAIKFYEPG